LSGTTIPLNIEFSPGMVAGFSAGKIEEKLMKRYAWWLLLCGLMATASCTFRDTSKNEETSVSSANRESPPPAGVTEDPGAPQSQP
jgi:hypothetical protein